MNTGKHMNTKIHRQNPASRTLICTDQHQQDVNNSKTRLQLTVHDQDNTATRYARYTTITLNHMATHVKTAQTPHANMTTSRMTCQ